MQAHFAVFLTAALVLVRADESVKEPLVCQVKVEDSIQLGLCQTETCDFKTLADLVAAFTQSQCAVSGSSGIYTCDTTKVHGSALAKCIQFKGVCKKGAGSWSSNIPGCDA